MVIIFNIPSFQYYPVIENKISDRVLKRIKGTMAAIIYLEKQKDEELLIEAVDTVVELIKEEHPEQLCMFTIWLNRMFHDALNEKQGIPGKGYCHSGNIDWLRQVSKEVYHIGASLKDLGKKWFAVSKMDLNSFEIVGKLI